MSKEELKTTYVPTTIHSDSGLIVSGIQYQREFLEFAKWSATPRHFKTEKTQKEFASVIGVCEDTLTDWKRHPRFKFILAAFLQEWMGEQVPEVIGALYETATGAGKAREVEAFLRLAGVITAPKK